MSFVLCSCETCCLDLWEESKLEKILARKYVERMKLNTRIYRLIFSVNNRDFVTYRPVIAGHGSRASLRHILSSLARKPGSWVLIPLKACICVRAFIRC
jgi:hypothetical protein